MIKWMKSTYLVLEVIAGKVVTREQAATLIAARAGGLRISMGSGSAGSYGRRAPPYLGRLLSM